MLSQSIPHLSDIRDYVAGVSRSKWYRVIAVLFIAVSIPPCFVIFRSDWMRQFYLQRFHIPDENVDYWQKMTACAATVGLTLVAVIWMSFMEMRIHILRCPSCGKNTIFHHRIVIATKNCPYCGNQVLKQESSVNS